MLIYKNKLRINIIQCVDREMQYTNKFDIQLKRGLDAENLLHKRLEGSKIELKTETHQWELTGNIAIEFECNGKPSGLAVTEAEFWCHELRRENETLVYLIIPTQKLKDLCGVIYMRDGFKEGGDGSRSKMVLVPVREVLTLI